MRVVMVIGRLRYGRFGVAVEIGTKYCSKTNLFPHIQKPLVQRCGFIRYIRKIKNRLEQFLTVSAADKLVFEYYVGLGTVDKKTIQQLRWEARRVCTFAYKYHYGTKT